MENTEIKSHARRIKSTKSQTFSNSSYQIGCGGWWFSKIVDGLVAVERRYFSMAVNGGMIGVVAVAVEKRRWLGKVFLIGAVTDRRLFIPVVGESIRLFWGDFGW